MKGRGGLAGTAASSGVLLVGGASTRFGSPKALALLDGETLADRAGLELPFPLLDDGTEVRAALAAIVAGLRAASHDVAVVLPVDVPHMTPAALRRLADACRDAAVTPTGPLPGAFRKTALPALERGLAEGRLTIRDALAGLDTAVVELDPALLINVNTADDLRRLG